ncbi:MAG TPA: protein-methionine-sulfoxide reductase heme-binding subunit MsrQ [Gemmatimonadales bacterium]|nr:protein-methionine-sulfoxide reductase heme-binding subunit MsrQ [Gemmatimonadales bacterium]
MTIPRIKGLVWLAALAPLGVLVWQGLHDDLTADPVKYITHFTGRTALIILFITLCITPIRRVTGWNGIVRLRRLVGLFSFFYAVIHLLIYLAFDRGFVFTELGKDIAKRPYITIGFTAWLMLLALAVTSPQAVLRKMGGKRWRALHRLVYVVPVLGVIHFTWAQKKDIHLPLMYAAVLGGIYAIRLAMWARNRIGFGQPAGEPVN